MPLCANMSNICQRKWKCRLTFKEKTDILLEKVLKLLVLSERAFRKIQSSIYILCWSVCLNPINVKTAEPIGSKLWVGPHVTPGQIYECSELQKIVSKIFWILAKLFECARKYLEIHFFVFVSQIVQKANAQNEVFPKNLNSSFLSGISSQRL